MLAYPDYYPYFAYPAMLKNDHSPFKNMNQIKDDCAELKRVNARIAERLIRAEQSGFTDQSSDEILAEIKANLK